MASKRDNKLAWGISLLIFGILFFIKQLDIFPNDWQKLIFDYRNYPFILGVIFLLAHSNKSIGIILIGLATLFRLPEIIQLTRNISEFLWPTILITIGAWMIFSRK